MTAVIMDGKLLAAKLEDEMKAEVEGLRSSGVEPTLATVLVGEDEASRVYVRSKHRAAERVGIRTVNISLPATTREEELASRIVALNSDSSVNGILLQLPLPLGLSGRKMIETIDPSKDVDGLTSANAGRLTYGETDLIPCTPRGVMELLHHYSVKVKGAHATVINRSTLVGKPLYHLLLEEDATVTTCHSKTAGIASVAARADILVTAVGKRPGFMVTADMVKEGAAVIDVAMNRVGDKLLGDVDFEGVARKASFITPVPGGVGPMTVAMLMKNTIIAAKSQAGAVVRQVASH